MHRLIPRVVLSYQINSRCLCQHIYPKSLSVKKDSIFSNSLYQNGSYPHLQLSSVCHNKYNWLVKNSRRDYSMSNENQTSLSNKDKLKRAVKDYGATVVLFHVTISLMSLGTSYLIISSGVDVASLLNKIGFNSSNEVATGASTFVVAYAVHKMFAPVRISITLGSTPFIVRYLRRVGILKPPKPT